VEESRRLGKKVMDRCNLSVFEASAAGVDLAAMPEFLAKHKVQVVASLPCYTLDNVNAQRGTGVFESSMRALQQLNAFGYGSEESTGLQLDLVYNPLGAYLPGQQAALERDYKRELLKNFGVRFNNLYTITNMPIKRFADMLHKQGEYTKYMQLLVQSFNSATVDGLMCRDLVSINFDGRLSDCVRS
jgi:radical SAM/Cys-rich protein